MFILKTGHQPGVYVPLRALFLVFQYTTITPLQIIRSLWETLWYELDYKAFD